MHLQIRGNYSVELKVLVRDLLASEPDDRPPAITVVQRLTPVR